MSNIEPNIIDPGKSNPMPDVIVPDEEPGRGGVGSNDIEEPDGDDVPPILPDPEEGHRPNPSDIQHMA